MSPKLPAGQALTVPVVGIDVGYFSVKVAYTRASKQIQCLNFESIAPRVTTELMRDVGTSPLDVVTIKVGDLSYAVGPDADRRTRGLEVREIMDDYSETPEYKALFLGALYQAAKELLADRPNVNRLDIVQLVVGLPVSTLRSHSAVVRALSTGEHVLPPLPGTLSESLVVTVKKASVVAQPQGALVHFGSLHEGSNLLAGHNLVADLGGGTFDWFTAENNKPHYERCGSYKGGMLSIAQRVCDTIDIGLREASGAVQRIDTAIRTMSDTVKLGAKDVSLAPYEALIESMLDDGINKMMSALKSVATVDNILLTGGGGQRLRKAMEKRPALKQIPLRTDDQPIYSNVRGYFLIGEWLTHAKG